MRTVKEYVRVTYLGQEEILPVYQYVCYISGYEMEADQLHELYKQRSTSEFCDERDQSKLFLFSWCKAGFAYFICWRKWPNKT